MGETSSVEPHHSSVHTQTWKYTNMKGKHHHVLTVTITITIEGSVYVC
jgi:hypothetical protein